MPFLDLLVLEDQILSFHFLDLLIVLVDLDDLIFGCFFERLLLADLFHISDFISWHRFVQLAMLSQFIHNFKHVIFEAESCVPFPLEVDFNNETIAFEVDPSNIAELQINFVVKS